MKERLRAFWKRASPRAKGLLQTLARVLAMYLDDLLMVASGVCFVSAASGLFGAEVAKVVAGVCLLVYAVVVARAKRGGG